MSHLKIKWFEVDIQYVGVGCEAANLDVESKLLNVFIRVKATGPAMTSCVLQALTRSTDASQGSTYTTSHKTGKGIKLTASSKPSITFDHSKEASESTQVLVETKIISSYTSKLTRKTGVFTSQQDWVYGPFTQNPLSWLTLSPSSPHIYYKVRQGWPSLDIGLMAL